jgi:hypothetical protein
LFGTGIVGLIGARFMKKKHQNWNNTNEEDSKDINDPYASKRLNCL